MDKSKIINQISEKKVISIIRADSSDNILKIAEALLKGGIDIIEVSFNTPNALECIGAISQEFKYDVLVGAGTVLDAENAVNAINSGAKFIVSPVYNQGLISSCSRYGVVSIPGIFTPNEAINAYLMGSDYVKLFPAESLGPSYIKAILAPLPQLKIVAVGGININNAKSFLENGAVAIAIGSSLVTRNAVENNNFSSITTNAKQLINSIKNDV